MDATVIWELLRPQSSGWVPAQTPAGRAETPGSSLCRGQTPNRESTWAVGEDGMAKSKVQMLTPAPRSQLFSSLPQSQRSKQNPVSRVPLKPLGDQTMGDPARPLYKITPVKYLLP